MIPENKCIDCDDLDGACEKSCAGHKVGRYRLKVGKWGMYVHDTLESRDIDMKTVRDLLNSTAQSAPIDADVQEVVAATEFNIRQRSGRGHTTGSDETVTQTETLKTLIRAATKPAVPQEVVEVVQQLSANILVLMNVIKNPDGGSEFAKMMILEVAKDTVERAKALAIIEGRAKE